jgi:hypothetical protein
MTLPPGKPVLLTEFAAGGNSPLTIINLSASQTVFISGDGGLTDTNAVPMPAGTSLPWVAPGQVWALVPEGGATTTVVITSAVGLVPAVPAQTPSSDTWTLSQTGVVNGHVYPFTDAVPGQAWGSTLAYVTVALSGGANTPWTINLVQASIGSTTPLFSGVLIAGSPTTTSTTIGVPKVPYVVQAVAGNTNANTVTATVQLSPT